MAPPRSCNPPTQPQPTHPQTRSLASQGRATNRQTVRCGKCYTCLRPSLRKGCLNPLVKGDEAGEGPETTKLEVLLAGLLKMEREFWALAGGPWEGEEGAVHRIAWGSAVRVAANVQEVRREGSLCGGVCLWWDEVAVMWRHGPHSVPAGVVARPPACGVAHRVM